MHGVFLVDKYCVWKFIEQLFDAVVVPPAGGECNRRQSVSDARSAPACLRRLPDFALPAPDPLLVSEQRVDRQHDAGEV